MSDHGVSSMDKIHIAFDILDALEIKCQQNIEGAQDDIENIKKKMDELLDERAIGDLDPDEREKYFDFLEGIEAAQFTADFCKEILEAAIRRFIKLMQSSRRF